MSAGLTPVEVYRDDVLVCRYDDGGRAAAGFAGRAPGDCVCRAIAIAAELPYIDVYHRLDMIAQDEVKRQRRNPPRRSSPRLGVWRSTYDRLLTDLGWSWTPTMSIGSGCTVHLRADELPPGRLVVSVSRHLCAVVDGVIYDTHDPSRDGTRCVYGYWRNLR